MSTINDGGLLEALHGERGDLDGWLETKNESEVRAAILALVSPQETLRDKFAAKAMQAWLSNPTTLVGGKDLSGNDTDHARQISEVAYIQADAMLKAREAKP